MANTVPRVKPALPMQAHCADWLDFDLGEWPIVVVRGRQCQASNLDSRYEAFLHCFTALLNHNESFSLIFDIRKCNKFPIPYVIPLAQFLNTMKPKIQENLMCSAIVSSDWIVKGVIRTVFTLHPATRPNITTSDPAEAARFVQAHFRADYDRGIDVHDGFDQQFSAEQLAAMEQGRQMLTDKVN